MVKENNDVRQAAKRNGVALWAVADDLGISEATMTRLLRRKLSDGDRSRVMDAINRLGSRNNASESGRADSGQPAKKLEKERGAHEDSDK